MQSRSPPPTSTRVDARVLFSLSQRIGLILGSRRGARHLVGGSDLQQKIRMTTERRSARSPSRREKNINRGDCFACVYRRLITAAVDPLYAYNTTRIKRHRKYLAVDNCIVSICPPSKPPINSTDFFSEMLLPSHRYNAKTFNFLFSM